MSDDESIYEPIWKVLVNSDNDINNVQHKPAPRNDSVRTYLSGSEDGWSQCFKDFEGESIDNLDVISQSYSCDTLEKLVQPKFIKQDSKPFPKQPCFSEFDENDKLEYNGPITQIVQKLTTSKKNRYAVLISNKLVLFEKPEHKVSKIQIPLTSVTGIDWIDNVNYNNKNDCNKFRLDTPVRSFKFQCTSHENASLWINHIGKLIYDKQNIPLLPYSYILKAHVSLENVKGKRIFTIEQHYTVAYYETDDDYKYGIAMHRIQLRSSGVKRDSDSNCLILITSYRKYKLTFDTSKICNEWFETLSAIIQKAISSTSCSKNAKSGEEILKEMLENESNRYCAECRSPDIEWASINLFVTLCSKCSGLHRGLGPNISRIQGIFTDESKWEDSNLIKLFQVIGNDKADYFWMGNYTNNREGAEIDRRFLYDKYDRKKFIKRKDLVFEKYKDLELLNEELFECVRSDNIIRTMMVFHIGADLNHVSQTYRMDVSTFASKINRPLHVTYFSNQCKSKIKDWRSESMEINENMITGDIPFLERCLFCSINQNPADEKLIVIWRNGIQILQNRFSKREICKVLFHNICLVRETKSESDSITLVVVTRETEYSSPQTNSLENMINVIEFYSSQTDQSNDLSDFKNMICQNMYPRFIPTSSIECLAWVILSSANEEWKPFLLSLNYNSIIECYDPKDIQRLQFVLDLRKVHKVEELRENKYETVCPFKMYNLASIHLISAVIYYMKADTKEACEEMYKAIYQSWNMRDGRSLANQFLTQNNVPLSIDKMIKYLQVHGTQIEGLFRRVGSVKEAERIYNQLISNPNSYLLTNCETHDIGSALKLTFRKLENPLLTNELYENWIFAADIENAEEKFSYYREIINALPSINYQTLRLLIFLCVNIDKNYDITQMNPDNIGTSFGTCLLTNSTNEIFNPKHLQILPYLIRNYQDLFDVTEEELELERMYTKERKKFTECNPSETSLLRQIYIHPDLVPYLKTDMNFEKENSESKMTLLSKQMRIEQSMTSVSLLKKLFNEDDQVNKDSILIFEDRKIDDLQMHRLIYPLENLIKVIQIAEQSFEGKVSIPQKWIFKLHQRKIQSKFNQNTSFKCWASSNKNKVFIELSETNQINIWKNDQMAELLINIPIKDMTLFRSCNKDKFVVAFQVKKSHNSALPSFLQLFSFKHRSSFDFITFFSNSDYLYFLEFYDKTKLWELTPISHRTDIALII